MTSQVQRSADDVPAYYAHMGPVNAVGPAPLDLTEPQTADAAVIAARLAASEWVVDLPHDSRRHVGQAGVDLVGGDVHGALDPALRALGSAPYIDNDHIAGQLSGEFGEDSAREGDGLVAAGQPVAGGAGGGAGRGGGPVDADAGQFALGDGKLFGGFGEEADGGCPGDHPDEVRGDLAVGLEVEGSSHVALGERHPVAVHCAGGMRAAITASLLHAASRDVVAVDDPFDAAPDAAPPLTSP